MKTQPDPIRRTCTCVLTLAASASIALSGCNAKTLTFKTPEYHQVTDEWKFRNISGKHITTDHFEIYTTSDDPKFVEFAPKFLETNYQLYSMLVPPPKDETQDRMSTYVFSNRHEWEAFVRQEFPQRYGLYRMISAGGFAVGGQCVVYDIGRAPTLSVVAHEGLHQYFGSHFTSSPLPAWVNEGLATYCETVEFRGTDNVTHYTPQQNTFRTNHLRNAMSLGDTLPLRELLATNAGKVIEGNQVAATATYYAQAWALVVYLQHGAKGRYADGFRSLLDDIGNGSIRIKAQGAKVAAPSPADTSYGEAVFYAYITTDVPAFEREWFEWLKKLCWKN